MLLVTLPSAQDVGKIAKGERYLVLTLKAASIWALRMLHLRWSGSMAGEAGGCRDFSDSCFSSPCRENKER